MTKLNKICRSQYANLKPRSTVFAGLMVLLAGCAGPHVGTNGHYGFRALPDKLAFSDDSRRVAFAIKQSADATTRLYWGTPGLFNGWDNCPSIRLWGTTRRRVSVCWVEVSKPQILQQVDLPEVTLDETIHFLDGVRGLAFNSDATRLAVLDAQQLSVIRLADGRVATWRRKYLARFTWVGTNRLAVLACEAGPDYSTNDCLAVTHHIEVSGNRLCSRRVDQQKTQQFKGSLSQTAYFTRVIWNSDGLPNKIGSSVYGSRVKIDPPSIPDPPFNTIDPNRMIILWPMPAPPRTGRINLGIERAFSPDERWFCVKAEFLDHKSYPVILVDCSAFSKTIPAEKIDANPSPKAIGVEAAPQPQR